jgi:amino acid transporter
MSDSIHQQDEGLVRAIGPRALGVGVVNMVVGGGIFTLPGIVALQLGPAAIIAYLVCAVAVGLVFLCFAEIGTRITRSGGAYAYVEDAFGPFAGFITSMLLWLGYSAFADAAITVAMVNTIAIAFPVLSEPVPRAIFIVALFAFLAAVNVRGVKAGVRLYVFNTMAKLVPLLLLIAFGLFAINIDNLRITEWPSLQSIGATAIIVFFIFSGAECALNASGEIRNPRKTVPLGILLGLSGILMLYVGLQTVAQGVLGPELANNTDAPLAAAATEVFGDWGAKMLLVGGVISIYASVSGDMLGAPRVIFASARDGNLPAFLARVHPKYKTPHMAVILFAVVVGIVALSGTFRVLAIMASAALLTIDAAVCLAVLRLRRLHGEPGEGEFRLPFGPVIPISAFLLVGWLLWQLTGEEFMGLAALIGVSILIYVIGTVTKRVVLRGKSKVA